MSSSTELGDNAEYKENAQNTIRLPDQWEAEKLTMALLERTWDKAVGTNSDNWEKAAATILVKTLNEIKSDTVETDMTLDNEIYYENSINGTEFEYIVNGKIGRFCIADKEGNPYMHIVIRIKPFSSRVSNISICGTKMKNNRIDVIEHEYKKTLSQEEVAVFAYLLNKYADQRELYEQPLSYIFQSIL